MTHPRSPVQPGGRFRWEMLGLAPLAAGAWWASQNDWPVENMNPAPAETAAPAPAVPPKANLAAVFTSDDYPAEAMRNGEQGTSAFTLKINRRGRVTDCTMTRSSGSKVLDRASCSIVTRRARFTPARDSKGRAVASTAHNRIRWVLPPE